VLDTQIEQFVCFKQAMCKNDFVTLDIVTYNQGDGAFLVGELNPITLKVLVKVPFVDTLTVIKPTAIAAVEIQ
jgi:hypothetical protein